MHNIDRIIRMEKILDEASTVLKKLTEAANAYAALQADLGELEDYYGSSAWMQDYEADESGLLPADLKRGVLSQDAVYDLLSDHDALKALLREIAFSLENEKTAPDEV